MKKNTSKILDPGQSKLSSLLDFALFAVTPPGLKLIRRKLKKALIKPKAVDYAKWIAAKTQPDKLQQTYEQNQPMLVHQPKISVIIALISPEQPYLAVVLDSVARQLYPTRELIVIDNTNNPAVYGLLKEASQKDVAIKVATANTATTIAAGYHAGIALATGDYLLFAEEDTRLTPNCLAEFGLFINRHPEATIVYADEDTAEQNKAAVPNFKPGWSPDTLLSRNYIGDAFLMKRKLCEQAGGVQEGYEGNELYDLLLRATELNNNIGRIPEVLFHKHSKPVIETTAVKAISDALMRRGTPATVSAIAGNTGCYNILYEIRQHEKVSVIIPTKDRAELLQTAIDSIMQKTNYPDFEVIVLNNNSSEASFFELMQRYQQMYPGRVKCTDAAFDFNFARLMNIGVAAATGKFVVFCNNDIEVIEQDWMERMVRHAQNKRTGAMGMQLLYPNNTIQHAGIVLGINGDAGHAFINYPAGSTGYQNNLVTATNYAAVTGACLMCRKELYLEAGGMDEALEIEYNDLDLCLKFLQMGHYNICLPGAAMYHHESVSRGNPFRNRKTWRQHERELTIFKNRWQQYINDDPFYNPNLTTDATDFSIKVGS